MKGLTLLVMAAVLVPNSAGRAAEVIPAPTAITACGALTKGSYVLAKNLTAAGDCLKLVGNFVTIDLAGFVITGNGTGSGIRAGTALTLTGIAIRNGTITNFAVGINLPSSSEVLIEGMRMLKNKSTAVSVGENSIARDNIADDNGGTGLILQNGSEANGNVANNNFARGFLLFGASIAIGNMAAGNGSDGIVTGVGSTIVNNSVVANDANGLVVNCPGNVIGNTAVNNSADDIFLSGTGCNTNNNVS